MGGNFVRFGLLRWNAESRLRTGRAFPGTFTSIASMQNAAPSRPETSLVLAIVQGNLGIGAVARQMGRSFGQCGGVARQDVLAATDVQVNSNNDDYEA